MKEQKRFKVIECSGSFYEIGFHYGTACRDSIRTSLDGLIRGITNAQGVSPAEVLATAAKYRPLVERYDPDLLEMLQGQAEGAGITPEESFALRCGTELNFFYRRITTLCTSFAVTGRATQGRRTIIGQTYDFGPGTTLDLVKTRFPNGLEQLSLVVGAGIGGEVLVNSAGIGMVLNIVVGSAEEQRLNVPFACLIPRVMRQKRIGDALGTVCAFGRSILYYGFGSHEGDIIGIETRPEEYHVIYPENDVLLHTNHSVVEHLKRGDTPFGFMEGDSYIRLNRIRSMIERQYGRLTPEAMMEMLSDHTDYPRSICKHIDQGTTLGETLTALVIVPEERSMYVTYGHPCCHEFMKYEL